MLRLIVAHEQKDIVEEGYYLGSTVDLISAEIASYLAPVGVT